MAWAIVSRNRVEHRNRRCCDAHASSHPKPRCIRSFFRTDWWPAFPGLRHLVRRNSPNPIFVGLRFLIFLIAFLPLRHMHPFRSEPNTFPGVSFVFRLRLYRERVERYVGRDRGSGLAWWEPFKCRRSTTDRRHLMSPIGHEMPERRLRAKSAGPRSPNSRPYPSIPAALSERSRIHRESSSRHTLALWSRHHEIKGYWQAMACPRAAAETKTCRDFR